MVGPTPEKKPSIALTVGSKVSIRSASGGDEVFISEGTFRGLVSVGGDSSIALELESGSKAEKGRVRLIPLNAVLSVDVLQAKKIEQEKRAEPPSTEYFR
jgi:hypothetical protein